MVSGTLLEVFEPVGALERIEAHLRRAGFFGPVAERPRDHVADVFLGYALSEPQRRTGRPPRPEPLPLPVAACRVRAIGGPADEAGSFGLGAWERSWDAADYERAVRSAREAIAAGEVYQVNLVQHLSAPFSGDAVGVQAALAGLAPRHATAMSGDSWTIATASPELFLARRGRRLWTEPIKGTRPAGQRTALRTSSKDAAEHVMIVDLERNDLGRICVPGSVTWPELMAARSMAGVEHLVSRVEGVVSEDTSWAATMAAMFPGGSVTGAPKIAALDHINALEPVGRGASMGALGTVWPNGDFELALTIRTFAVGAGHIHLWVGGGIVWDSDPALEVEESWVKARPLLEAIAAAARPAVAV